jgi:hypothetical protein
MNSKSFAEIYRLSFTFLGHYITAFTPQIDCSEVALQFEENTVPVFLCGVNTNIVSAESESTSSCRAESQLYIDYNILARMGNGGIIAAIFLGVENSPTKTLHIPTVRREAI